MDCNTGTGKEAAVTLSQFQKPNFMLNWDPGNAATFPGDTPYPDDYDLLPKNRIGHCHAKIRVPQALGASGSGRRWARASWIGSAQLHALERDGYHYAVSLETHWRGAGTPEASSRVSMQGLKDALAKAGTGC